VSGRGRPTEPASPVRGYNRGVIARYRLWGGLAATACVLGVPAGTASGTALSSGLTGFVLRAPVAPICMPRIPCMRPAAGVVLAFRRGVRDEAHVTTAQDGSYRVLLSPGTYGIRITRPLTRRVMPAQVTVYAGQLRRVNVYLDTGIR
jgi:hypothetical protein